MLFGAVDEDKSKEFGLVGSPIILSDVGLNLYKRKGIDFNLISNGYSFRYRPALDQPIPMDTFNSSPIYDTSTTESILFKFTIPGNSLQPNDYVLIDYVLFGNLSSARQRLFVGSNPEPYVAPRLSKTNSITTTQLKIEAIDSNMFLITTLGTGFSNTDTLNGVSYYLINSLGDITITLNGNYQSITNSKSFNLVSATATYKSTYTPSIISNTSPYRLPDKNPFSNSSPWNLPLPPQTIRATGTHPFAVSIRDRYFGRRTKDGTTGGATVVHWSLTNETSPNGPEHIPVINISKNDPISDWYVRPGLAGIHFNGIYFIKDPVSSGSVGYTYKIRSPNTQLFPGQVGDKAIILITECKRFAIEVGRYSWNATLKRHEVNRLSIVDLYGKGYSYQYYPFDGSQFASSVLTPEQYGYNMYYRAGGNPFIGGLIRKEELDNLEINHMVAMMMSDYIGKCSKFTIVSTSGNTFVIKSRSATFTFVDYSSIFGVVGQRFRIRSDYHTNGGTVYSSTGNCTYDNTTGYTTFTVNETIQSYTGTTITIGGSWREYFLSAYNWPMVSRDASADDSGYFGIIPMGQVFTYESSLNINSMGLTSPESIAIATAIKKYGAMIMDVAGNTTNICQCDQLLTTTQRSRIRADAAKLISFLVPVTNYDRTLYQQALADTTIAKPRQILPLYG